MLVIVRMFGHYRDIAGDNLQVELPEGATLADLAKTLASGNVRLSLLGTHCRGAINQEYVPSQTALSEGDEVAFIPPMSGG